jgi:CDP-paratose 2-epimerase
MVDESWTERTACPKTEKERDVDTRPGPTIGLLEWFRPGEHARVEQVLADMRELGVTHLRTGLSWADSLTPEGDAWYAWLFPRLSSQVELLPCVHYTPPSEALAPKSSAPPRNPKAYADFLDVIITRYGQHFEWVEFWNEPNNLSEWDWTLDPGWQIFCEMVGGAAHWARHRGKKTLLGGMAPLDPNWLRLMFDAGVMAYIDAIGIHAFPGTWDLTWEGWAPFIAKAQEVIQERDSNAEIWITETGYSTWRLDERRQLTAFVEAIEAPVDRVYWYGARDLDPDLPTVDGFHSDEREYHFGLRRADGGPKLLYRLWAQGGVAAVRDALPLCVPAAPSTRESRPTLITGGAGFLGTNLADRLLSSGLPVLLFDNLSRAGAERNVRWLKHRHGERAQIEVADVRDAFALKQAVRSAEHVFHFAGQVTVTGSQADPVHDFDVNARGTLNLLEALRTLDSPPTLVFASTNKVYGNLEDVALNCHGNRYEPGETAIRLNGIGEDQPLDFRSPYGCSKGAADQYVLDYGRTFGMPAVVLRMSCIYGVHQCGTEDQGWLAHFLRQTLAGRPITIFGDGRQVRDVLFAEDFVDACLLAQSKAPTLAGQAFNLGGGPANSISLLELLDLIDELHGQRPEIHNGPWRSGDQWYFVADTAKFRAATGWAPRVHIRQGLQRVHDWLRKESSERPVEAASGPRRVQDVEK